MKIIQFRNIWLILLTLISSVGLADSGLIDPSTGKYLTYTNQVLKSNSKKLNLFDEFDIIIPVIVNEPNITADMKKYLFDLATDEIFFAKLNRSFKKSLNIFIKQKVKGNEYGDYQVEEAKSQVLTVEEMAAWPIFYQNGQIGFKLECDLNNPKDYQNNRSNFKYCETIIYDTKTNKILPLSGYCSPKNKIAFQKYLDRIYNESTASITSKQLQEENEEEDEGEDSSSSVKDQKNKPQRRVLDINEVLFDLNKMCFTITEYSPNSEPTNGEGFSINYEPDSIAKYLAFTRYHYLSPANVNLNAQKTNELFMPVNIYPFANDEYVLKSLKKNLQKQNFKLYYRQNNIKDTLFKFTSEYRYSNGHLSEIVTENGSKPNTQYIKKYTFNEDRLTQIGFFEGNKELERESYVYKDGFLVSYKKEDFRNRKAWEFADPSNQKITFFYDNGAIHKCLINDNYKRCDTYRFDINSDLISIAEKGTAPTTQNIYRDGKLMAVKSVYSTYEIYISYNNDGKLDTKIADYDRYFTKYYYNTNGDVMLITRYDSNILSQKEQYIYDTQNRLIKVIRQNFSYGQLQTELEYKLQYDFN